MSAVVPLYNVSETFGVNSKILTLSNKRCPATVRSWRKRVFYFDVDSNTMNTLQLVEFRKLSLICLRKTNR